MKVTTFARAVVSGRSNQCEVFAERIDNLWTNLRQLRDRDAENDKLRRPARQTNRRPHSRSSRGLARRCQRTEKIEESRPAEIPSRTRRVSRRLRSASPRWTQCPLPRDASLPRIRSFVRASRPERPAHEDRER